MRAVEIAELTGPRTALRLSERPDPQPSHPIARGEGVVIDVKAAGVSFPDLLQTRGEYQVKPELPFVPGGEVSGIVRSAPEGHELAAGDRAAALCMMGGFAELAVAPASMAFALPEKLDFAQGAALVVNYHTAYFALATRGRLRTGETVLIHGAAGGVGTAAIQVAKGLGARTIAVVSSDDKAAVARDAGADETLRAEAAWKDDVLAMTGGNGVDVIVDPVGGDRFTDSLRALASGGRLVVVGFAGGGIPEVKVNRLLLKNTEVVGAGWGEHLIATRLAYGRQVADALAALTRDGHVKPIVSARLPLERAADALELLDARRATGKIVLEP
jgi:NADPH2:quinone reductase